MDYARGRWTTRDADIALLNVVAQPDVFETFRQHMAADNDVAGFVYPPFRQQLSLKAGAALVGGVQPQAPWTDLMSGFRADGWCDVTYKALEAKLLL